MDIAHQISSAGILDKGERRLGYEIIVVPVTIGALGGCIKKMISDISRIFEKDELVEKNCGGNAKDSINENHITESALRIDSKER